MPIPRSVFNRTRLIIGGLFILGGIILLMSIFGILFSPLLMLIGFAFLYDYVLECVPICNLFLMICLLITKNYFIAFGLLVFAIFLIKQNLKKFLLIEKEKKYSRQN